MNKFYRCLALMAIVVSLSAHHFSAPVFASPDLFSSHPTTHDLSNSLTVDCPERAYDHLPGTCAITFYSKKSGYGHGWFELKSFQAKATGSITEVDMKILYKTTLSSTDAMYKISYWVDPSNSEKVIRGPVREAVDYSDLTNPLVIDGISEPNDGVWTWDDVSKLRVRFTTDDPKKPDTDGMLCIYEIWLRITYVPSPPPGIPGPFIDRLRFKVIRGPDARRLAMLAREVDVLACHARPADYGHDHSFVADGALRPEDIEDLAAAGKTITSTSGFHLCNFIFNLRPTLIAGPEAGNKNPLHDVNYRHALFHLMPKARIIGSLFRYTCVQADCMVPAALSEWMNSYVDAHPFSDPATLGENCESVKILKAAGYQPQGSFPYTTWLDPTGNPLTPIRVYVPLLAVAPTSYSVGKQWVDQCDYIGLDNVVLSPEEFSPYINKMYNDWDFEIAFSCGPLERFPDYLHEWFHSSENYMRSINPSGIYWPALDADVALLKTGLVHTDKVIAAKHAQVLVAGGTPTAPLPIPAPTNDNHWNWSLARMPVYSRNYYSALQPEVRGAVNMRGHNIDNMWTFLNIHWNVDPATIDRVDPDGSVFMVWGVNEYPERLNPLWMRTAYAWEFASPVYDSLIAINPWTHHDEPWIATDWEYLNLTGQSGYPSGTKMGVRFWLRDDVYWQDGEKFTVDDVKWNWEFLRDWALPNFWYFSRYIVDVEVDYNENSVTAFMSRTSQWDLYDLAATAALLCPRVWEKNPITGDDWTDVTEIEGFDPSQLVPSGAYYDPGTPTYLIGTGPYIFKFYDTPGAYGDLDAWRGDVYSPGYWLTTGEIEDKLKEYLWRTGDTDYSAEVGIEDMATVSFYFGQEACILEVNSVSGGSWNRVGESPYLHRRCDADHIWSNTDGQVSADYGFEDTTLTQGVQKVELCIEAKRLPMDMGDYSWIKVELYNGTTWHYVADAGNLHATKKYHFLDVTHILDTEAKINAAIVRFTYNAGGSTSTIYISYACLRYFGDLFYFNADFTGPMGSPPDGETDADDMVCVGKFFGETITVPWP